MTNDIQNHSVVYNIITSLPIIGTPSRFLFDYTRMGISQYGAILGLIRGGLVGIVMFVMMLTLSEGIPLCWEIVHYYFEIHYVEPVRAEERTFLVELGETKPHRHERFEFELNWLDPGRYLLREDPKPPEPSAEAEGR